MRELVAAFESLRAGLNRVIAALEQGNNEKAIAELDKTNEQWNEVVKELRS
jgi:hypothetical protein